MDLGYARVSTTKQDLDRQLDALGKEGIPDERIWADKKTGATRDRDGLNAALGYARDGDTIVVCTLDRLGRNIRETLNLIHELGERGIGLRSLHDPIPVDTNRNEAMAQMATLMLALFSEMERVYATERAAHARAVRRQTGAPVGRRRKMDDDTAAMAKASVDAGVSVPTVASRFGVSRATLYRYLSSTQGA